MSKNQFYIPDKIKVGFQTRSGTYSGKLAYVIYYDDKGVLRKQKSWDGWRDQKIQAVEFENKPFDGFVLNKKVGDYKSDWHHRSAHIRVYDARDFEFEIDVNNLMSILAECDCSKGKGLEGKFVYAWDGTELVLLPASTQIYKDAKEYTSLQSKAVSAKELVRGGAYMTKRQETLVYIGRLDYYEMDWAEKPEAQKRYGDDGDRILCSTKRHVFKHTNSDPKVKNFAILKDLKSIACAVSTTPVSDFAELVQQYHESVNGSKAVEIFLRKDETIVKDAYWHKCFAEISPGRFLEMDFAVRYNERANVSHKSIWSLEDGKLKRSKPTYRESHTYIERDNSKWVELTDTTLIVKMESGTLTTPCYRGLTKV